MGFIENVCNAKNQESIPTYFITLDGLRPMRGNQIMGIISKLMIIKNADIIKTDRLAFL